MVYCSRCHRLEERSPELENDVSILEGDEQSCYNKVIGALMMNSSSVKMFSFFNECVRESFVSSRYCHVKNSNLNVAPKRPCFLKKCLQNPW